MIFIKMPLFFPNEQKTILHFQFLLGAGQGILHVGVQAVLLGVVLLAGDILLGLDKEFYVSSTSVVTLISMVVVVLTLVVSQISSQVLILRKPFFGKSDQSLIKYVLYSKEI